MYLSRANLPFSFKKDIKKLETSFNYFISPKSLEKFCLTKNIF